MMVVHSRMYRNIRYVLDDGWSMSGSMLPNSVIGSEIPIRLIISSSGILLYIVIGRMIMVVMTCVYQPYLICPLKLVIIVLLGGIICKYFCDCF